MNVTGLRGSLRGGYYTAFGGGCGGNGTAILAFKPVYHPGTVISIH